MDELKVLDYLVNKYSLLTQQKLDYKSAEFVKNKRIDYEIKEDTSKKPWDIRREIEREHPELIIKEPSSLEIKETGKMIRRLTIELESGVE